MLDLNSHILDLVFQTSRVIANVSLVQNVAMLHLKLQVVKLLENTCKLLLGVDIYIYQ